jgi:hypothetical protein
MNQGRNLADEMRRLSLANDTTQEKFHAVMTRISTMAGSKFQNNREIECDEKEVPVRVRTMLESEGFVVRAVRRERGDQRETYMVTCYIISW